MNILVPSGRDPSGLHMKSSHEINGMAKTRYLAHLHRSTISVDDLENVSRQWGKVKLWKNTPKDFKLKAKAKYNKFLLGFHVDPFPGSFRSRDP